MSIISLTSVKAFFSRLQKNFVLTFYRVFSAEKGGTKDENIRCTQKAKPQLFRNCDSGYQQTHREYFRERGAAERKSGCFQNGNNHSACCYKRQDENTSVNSLHTRLFPTQTNPLMLSRFAQHRNESSDGFRRSLPL